MFNHKNWLNITAWFLCECPLQKSYSGIKELLRSRSVEGVLFSPPNSSNHSFLSFPFLIKINLKSLSSNSDDEQQLHPPNSSCIILRKHSNISVSSKSHSDSFLHTGVRITNYPSLTSPSRLSSSPSHYSFLKQYVIFAYSIAHLHRQDKRIHHLHHLP